MSTNDLSYDIEQILDWAHIGRMLKRADQAIAPLAYARLTDSGSAFELWDLFVRFRHYVCVGDAVNWQQFAAKLAYLLDLRRKRDPAVSNQTRKASYSLSNMVAYLESNVESLIDYRTWRRVGCRIATGFVESSINRIVGRRMCKSQHMRWSRVGAHSVVKLRVALLNQEFQELGQRQFPWIGQRRYLAVAENIPAFLTDSLKGKAALTLQGREKRIKPPQEPAKQAIQSIMNRQRLRVMLSDHV